MRPPGWTRQASCNGMASGAVDPWDTDAGLVPIARRICAACPVRYPCALEALEGAIPHGLWGGLDPTDRRRIARKHGYPNPGAAQHGDYSRYVTCTDGPDGKPCEDCREAKRRYMQQRRARGLEPRPRQTRTLTPEDKVLRAARRAEGPVTARAIHRATRVKAFRVRQIVAAAEQAGKLPPGRLAA